MQAVLKQLLRVAHQLIQAYSSGAIERVCRVCSREKANFDRKREGTENAIHSTVLYSNSGSAAAWVEPGHATLSSTPISLAPTPAKIGNRSHMSTCNSRVVVCACYVRDTMLNHRSSQPGTFSCPCRLTRLASLSWARFLWRKGI